MKVHQQYKQSHFFKHHDVGGLNPSNHVESIAHMRYSRYLSEREPLNPRSKVRHEKTKNFETPTPNKKDIVCQTIVKIKFLDPLAMGDQ